MVSFRKIAAFILVIVISSMGIYSGDAAEYLEGGTDNLDEWDRYLSTEPYDAQLITGGNTDVILRDNAVSGHTPYAGKTFNESIFKLNITTPSSIKINIDGFTNPSGYLYKDEYSSGEEISSIPVSGDVYLSTSGVYYLGLYSDTNDTTLIDDSMEGNLEISSTGLSNNPELYNVETTYDGFNEGEATNSGSIKIIGEYNDSQGVTIEATTIGGIGTPIVTKDPGRGSFELIWNISDFESGDYNETVEIEVSNDSGGLFKKSVNVDFTVDTTPPQPPTISNLSEDTDSGIKGDRITNISPYYLVGQADQGSKINIYYDGSVYRTININNAMWRLDSMLFGDPFSEGEHIFKATALDDVGNESSYSNSFEVILDETPPNIPNINEVNDGSSIIREHGITSSSSINLKGSATSGTSISVHLNVGDEEVASTNIGYISSNEWTSSFDNLEEGTYSAIVTATDIAGNESNEFLLSEYFTIDQTIPIININGIEEADDTGEIGDDITRSTDVTINGDVKDSIDETIEVVDVFIDGTLLGSTNVNSEGKWTYTLNELVPGDLTFTIKATDSANNLSSKDYQFSITSLENDPIQTPSIKGIRENDDTGLIGDGETRAKYISFEGSAEPSSTVTLSVEQTISLAEEETVEERSINMLSMPRPYPENITANRTSSDGYWSTFSEYFEPGEYIITANSKDAADNISKTSETYSLLIDPNPMQSPVVTGIDKDTGYSNSDYVTNDRNIIVTGESEINSYIDLNIKNPLQDETEFKILRKIPSVKTNDAGLWSYDYSRSTLEEGEYHIIPTATTRIDKEMTKAEEPYQTLIIDITPPEISTEPAIVINEGSTETYNPEVSLAFNVSDAKEVIISNLSDLSDSYYDLYSDSMGHEISADSFGEKTIYGKFRDLAGNETDIFSSKINLLPTNLTIKYEYGSGDKAVDEYKEELVFNTKYNVESPNIEGYVPDMQEVSGNMDEVNKEIIVTYEKADYQVIFETNGGSKLESKDALYQGKLSKPVDPIKNGYIFDGWYKESSLENKWDFEVDIVTSDMTLYAKWLEDNSSEDTSPSRRRQSDLAETSANNKEFTSSVKKERVNGNDIITVDIDPAKIAEIISNQTTDQGKDLQVNVKDKFTETAKIKFDGKTVKDLEDNNYNIKVDKNNVEYNLPAKEINIERIAKELNIDKSLMDEIEVSIEVSEVKGDVLNKYKEMVKNNNSELIIEPISFNIVAKKNGQENQDEIKVHRFKRYVERVIEIPSNLDPKTITTGVVFNEDGSYSHVPTEVFEKDGKYYARINSLTNSDYSLINNKVEVPNIKGHWAENTIIDLGNRMIIVDISDFKPDSKITRGKFAEYITRALGIHRKGVANSSLFTDVSQGHPLADAITLAQDYNIISGYPNGHFKPEKTITRQEAMSMYARAMRAISFEDIQGSRIEEYEDKEEVAEWAYADVSKVLNAKVFNGRNKFRIAPNETFTYAEAASAIKNLLVKSNLINE